jgi:hypothetical protein
MGVYKLSEAGGLKALKPRYSSMAAGFVPLSIEYVVVAGGGAGASHIGYNTDFGSGGGGGGGFRSSVVGVLSGGGASAEPLFYPALSTNFSVTVGAGAPAPTDAFNNTFGSNSVFASFTSTGGGRGAGGATRDRVPTIGGSGGGGTCFAAASGAAGTSGQGFAGGNGAGDNNTGGGGGGGGAGAVGSNASSGTGGAGGSGLLTPLTGTTFARGGNGGSNPPSVFGAAGAANTGNGGAASSGRNIGAGGGGSGIVLLRYPAAYTITVGAGLTGSTVSGGTTKTTTITAGTGNVSWVLT